MDPLEYDRTSFRVSRRQWRMLMLLTVLNTALLGWFVAGPATMALAKTQWAQFQERRAAKAARLKTIAAQDQLLAHAYPPGTVIAEEDAESAKKLIEGSDYAPESIAHGVMSNSYTTTVEKPVVRSAVPAGWKQYADDMGISSFISSGAAVFAGERSDPSGKRMLVTVRYGSSYLLNTHSGEKENHATVKAARLLSAMASAPITPEFMPREGLAQQLEIDVPEVVARRAPSTLPWRFKLDPPFTLLAGQADPADKSHILIAYRMNGREGVLDLYLTNDGLEFRAAAGVIDRSGGTPRWEPMGNAAATTAPSPGAN